MKRFVFLVFMICSLFCTSVYFESPIYAEEKEAIILYTNDVHCAIEGYANVAGYKAQLEAMGHDVLLIEEVNKLEWIDINDNFFDLKKYAGEGNIGHIIEEIKVDLNI